MLVLLGGLVVVFASACSDTSSPPEAAAPAQMVEDGSWYFKNQWPHDGEPYESASFIVYSDAASLDARQRLARLAEDVLAETVTEMGIDPDTVFRFPPDQDKIDLYANRYNEPDWGGGARGYYAGLIIWSFDHEAEERPLDEESVRPVLKHELVHVVESLLKGRFTGDLDGDDPRRMPVWFSEGIAEALSGGNSSGVVRDLDRMDALTAEYGEISPVSYRVDFPVTESNIQAVWHYYYPMSQLAVEYLIDADGLGKTPEVLTAVMVEMANDVPFATAFEHHMGISPAEYEAEFFALMNGYLPQSDTSTSVAPIIPAVVSMVAVVLMVGAMSWSALHWRSVAAATIPVGATAWSQGSRIGFISEVALAALLALGFSLLVSIQIGAEAAISDAEKAWGFAAVGIYLIASVAILMWAIRRWAFRTRTAFLIPLLVLVATGLAIITVELIF